MTKNHDTQLSKNLALIAAGLAAVLMVATIMQFLSRQSAHIKPILPVEHVTTGNVAEYSTLSIIADQKGFFRENGLDVSMQDYESGPNAMADLIAGKIDTATAADFVGVSNSFNNEPLKILATQMRAYSFFLVVRKDHGIIRPTDLKGKKIGVTRTTAGEFYLGQYLILNKLQLSDVTLVYDTPDNLKNLLVDDKLDGVVTFDPHIHDIQALLGKNAVVLQVQGNQRLSSLFYGSEKFVKERPEVVKRYLRALTQAEEYILEHNEDARKIVGNYLHYDDAYMQTVWSHFTVDLSLDQDLLISMEDQARWAIENRRTTAKKVPDYLNLIYFDGLEAVKPDGITIIR